MNGERPGRLPGVATPADHETAIITEEERRLISRHTKAALAVRKAHADCALTVGPATLDAINAR